MGNYSPDKARCTFASASASTSERERGGGSASPDRPSKKVKNRLSKAKDFMLDNSPAAAALLLDAPTDFTMLLL